MKKYKIFMLTAIFSIMAGSSALAGEWKQDDAGWWYDNGDTTYENNGWSWIGERWYYFTLEGYCLVNTTTPDGFQVDEHGAWIIDGVIQTKGYDVAVISPNLQFTKPDGFVRTNKMNKGIVFTGARFGIIVEDIDLGVNDEPLISEMDGVSCHFNSGEWIRHYIESGPYYSRLYSVSYIRPVGNRLHRVVFTGILNVNDTDKIMNDCVQ